MIDAVKRCPIITGTPECYGKMCAWWDADAGQCAVLTLSQRPGICCQPHGEYSDLEQTFDGEVNEDDTEDKAGIWLWE